MRCRIPDQDWKRNMRTTLLAPLLSLILITSVLAAEHEHSQNAGASMSTKNTVEGYFIALKQGKGWETFLSDDGMMFTSFTSPVKQVTGKAAYLEACARAPKVMDLVHEVWAGRRRLIDIEHPDLAIVQDIAVQAGQGRIADRSNERLGRSDTAIIVWRKILARELRAIAEGRPTKKWRVAPAEVVPTLGF